MKVIIHTFLLSLFLINVCALAQKPGDGVKNYAIMELKNGSGVQAGEAEIITDRLRIELFNTGRASIMERDQMKAIMKEQGFQASGVCSDDGCMVELGQMLGVERLVGGSIGKLGSMYLLNFRVIDVTTAKILTVVSLDIKGNIEEVVYKLKTIAWELVSETPNKKSSTLVVDKSQKESETVIKNPLGIIQKVFTNSEFNGDCSDKVYLRTIDFKDRLSFEVTPATRAEIDKDVRESLESVCEDEVDGSIDVIVATEEQISALDPNCKSGVVRQILDSYTVSGSGSSKVGTATVTYYFFENPRTKKYSFKATVTDNGSSASDDQQIIMNTFEELEDKLADVLDDYDDELEVLDPDNEN